MKIIRITGNRGTGKTTVLRAFRDTPSLAGSFLDLSNRPLKSVKQEIERLQKSTSLETRVTVLVDECTPDVELMLENIVCDKAVTVIISEFGGEAARQWRPMKTAPRDGTLLRLMVEFTEHSLEDSLEPVQTIGHCNENEDGRWQFAGWCWAHDHYTQGEGKPIGWLPFDGPAA